MIRFERRVDGVIIEDCFGDTAYLFGEEMLELVRWVAQVLGKCALCEEATPPDELEAVTYDRVAAPLVKQTILLCASCAARFRGEGGAG